MKNVLYIFIVLTSVAAVYPALEILDLGVLAQHLARVGLHPALVVLHVPKQDVHLLL